jgi:hypothetical protein|tara:strand:- start:4512 stop:4727 length:216 start_codon:yes stop_codon:yes gene_type:complete
MSENTEITEKRLPNPQRYRWKNVAYYDNYQEASDYRASLVDEMKVKIRRCGIDKVKFAVKVGTPIKGTDNG